jgi:hypothetical protein
MLSHADARIALTAAFKRLQPRFYPLTSSLQWAQAIGLAESGYGQGKAVNNWGNVQCSHGAPAINGECVILTDHHADGSAFEWPYRVYSTPEDGAYGMIDLINRKFHAALQAADEGRTADASALLYGYYTGVGPKDREIAKHAKGIYWRATQIAQALGEKVYLTDPSKTPAVDSRDPSMGPILAMGLGLFALVLMNVRK